MSQFTCPECRAVNTKGPEDQLGCACCGYRRKGQESFPYTPYVPYIPTWPTYPNLPYKVEPFWQVLDWTTTSDGTWDPSETITISDIEDAVETCYVYNC